MPERIGATPEEIAKAVIRMPPEAEAEGQEGCVVKYIIPK